MDFVELVFGFVALFRNREHAQAVNGRSWSTERGSREAKMVPTKIHRIGNEEKESKTGHKTSEKAYGGRGLRLRGHEVFAMIFCLGMRPLRKREMWGKAQIAGW